MNCKLIVVAIAAIVSLTSVAFAHDGHEHKGKPIEGTASAIEATRFKVKTDKGDSTVEINKDTSFEIGMDGKKGAVSDLKEGSYVMVEGTTLETGVVVATEVMVHPADASEAPVEEHAHH